MIDRTYTILGQLAALNEHDKANRTNRYGGARLKDRMTTIVGTCVMGKPEIEKPCRIKFIWHISTAHDPDNLRFAAKYVLDGLVHAGILPNDNQTWVRGFDGDDFVKVPKGQEQVIVEVRYEAD